MLTAVEDVLLSEISKVRVSLFQFEFAKDAMSNLPEPEGEVTTMTEKIFVPVKEHPDVSNISIFHPT